MRRALFAFALLAPVASLAQPSQEWVVTHDAGGHYVDTATLALVDAAGNLIVGGTGHDGVGGTDILVIKRARADGDPIWQAEMSAYDHASDMSVDGMAFDGQGNILVAGRMLGCGTG